MKTQMTGCVSFTPRTLAMAVGLVVALAALTASATAETRQFDVLYLKIDQPDRPTLSNLDPIPEDLGLRGAELAVQDNNTTGGFMGYAFVLDPVTVEEGDLAAAQEILSTHSAPYVLLDMAADQMVELAPAAPEKLLFNLRAYDDALRNEACQANLFHSLPSYAMRADALMQFVLKKRWDKMVLVEGNAPEDAAFAAALRRSAEKFQLSFKADQKWLFDGDIRRQASAEVPLFTQEFGEYDVMIVADEHNDFARYLAYNTWLPRPVLGGDGLRSTGWDRVNEQWGAAQLQSRFTDLSGREMQDEDYAAWAALRAVDEALVRTQFADLATLRSYLMTDLELAGFKGRPLSFRNWNGQLRQPIGLTHQSALVAMTPLEGFLHARNELDSLGIDETESACQAFK